MGRASREEPIYRYTPRTANHGGSDISRILNHNSAGAEHRNYHTPHGTHAARRRAAANDKRMYRVIRQRHPRRPRKDAERFHAACLRTQLRHFNAGRYDVSPQPQIDMFRYGFHFDSHRSDRRACRSCRSGRGGSRHYGISDERRDRFPGKLHPTCQAP